MILKNFERKLTNYSIYSIKQSIEELVESSKLLQNLMSNSMEKTNPTNKVKSTATIIEKPVKS